MRQSFCLYVISGFLVMMVACSPDTPKKVPNVAKPPETSKTLEVPEVVELNSNVDILIMIDDSGSMEDHQANLAKNMDLFVDAISQNTLIDWHIGVITTDMRDKNRKGKLYGYPLYVTKNTPDALLALKDHMRPGMAGDANEYGFDPVMAALSPPLSEGYNKGFLRPDAYLVVIFITDAGEASQISSPDFAEWLTKLKNGDKSKLMYYGALALPNTSCPMDPTGDYNKYLDFLSGNGGSVFDLCSPSFGANIAKIGIDVAKKVSQSFPLSARPIPETIVVKFGSRIIPNDPKIGWIYDPEKNLLRLSPDVDLTGQPAGTKVEITFKMQPYS